MIEQDQFGAPESLLTPSEVAALFRVNPKTVTRWARAGKLTAIRTLGGHRRFRASGDPALPRGDEHGRALTGDPSSGPQGVFAHRAVEGFEQLAFCHDAATGLQAIIAIHSTVLGPALGGTRFRPYATEADAVADVCRLARGMTYKHAVSGLDCGGGKAVILGDPRTLRSEPLLRSYARFIDGLAGRYLTAEDVGTTQADMDLIRRETPYVTGVSESLGGSGDPSPATAWGVLAALRTVGRRIWGSPSLADRHIVVVGVGKVGRALVEHLLDEGARVTVADVDPVAIETVVKEHGVATVEPADAHALECDVLSPCALGGVLNARTIPELRCSRGVRIGQQPAGNPGRWAAIGRPGCAVRA